MLHYVTVGTDDLDRAAAFYDEIFALLGVRQLYRFSYGIYYGEQRWEFCVLRPFDKEPASVGNGSMAMLAAPSRDLVDRVHACALTLGGPDEGAPGVRGSGDYYIAYFRDLDGNKLGIGHGG